MGLPSSCNAISASIPVEEFLKDMGNSQYVNISLVQDAKPDGYQYNEDGCKKEYLEFGKETYDFWSFEIACSKTEISWMNVTFPDSHVNF